VSVRNAIRRGFSAAARHAPTEVTIYRVTYPAADDPYSREGQHSFTTHYTRGTFAPLSTAHEPIESQGIQGGVVTLNTRRLGFVPSQADKISIGGVVFNVTDVQEVLGEVAKCTLRGPTVAPQAAAPGDITPPSLASSELFSGTGLFAYTATFTEAAEWRVRYAFNFTGQLTTEDWSGTTALTTGAQTITDLPAATYGVEIQMRDADGNTSGWESMGSAVVI
jgi:hypothetical protein